MLDQQLAWHFDSFLGCEFNLINTRFLGKKSIDGGSKSLNHKRCMMAICWLGDFFSGILDRH
jgi:hypothetical protein